VLQGRRWDGRMGVQPLRTSAFTGAIAGIPVRRCDLLTRVASTREVVGLHCAPIAGAAAATDEQMPLLRLRGLHDARRPSLQRLHMPPGTCPDASISTIICDMQVVLLRPADWDACNLFRGGRIYGGSYNELEAYLYFCRCLPIPGPILHVLVYGFKRFRFIPFFVCESSGCDAAG
jgi:hypothetical protein